MDASGLPGVLVPEQAGWPKHEHDDQDRENDHVRPTDGQVLTAEGLDEPDDDTAEHRTGNAADAAEHGCGKSPKAGRIADTVVGVVIVEPEDQAGRTGKSRTDKKRHHYHPVDL